MVKKLGVATDDARRESFATKQWWGELSMQDEIAVVQRRGDNALQ